MGLASFNAMYEELAKPKQDPPNKSTMDAGKLSVEQIKDKLNELGIWFDSQAKKPELLSLLNETLKQS